MAYALRDNRAFCKYLCPVAVALKTTSRLSMLTIEADRAKCTECEACVKMCPMDIQLLDYIRKGQRVLSTECMLCQTCITVCAEDALKVSFGFDHGGKEPVRLPRLEEIVPGRHNGRSLLANRMASAVTIPWAARTPGTARSRARIPGPNRRA